MAVKKPKPSPALWTDSVANDAKPRLLLVDDDGALLQVLAMRFKKAGFDIVTLHAGSDALQELSQLGPELTSLRPQAIITDYDMGGFTGKDLMQEAKRLHPTLPVYLLSGNDDAQRAARTSTSSARFDGVCDKADMSNAIPAVIDMLKERGIVPTEIQRAPRSSP